MGDREESTSVALRTRNKALHRDVRGDCLSPDLPLFALSRQGKGRTIVGRFRAAARFR